MIKIPEFIKKNRIDFIRFLIENKIYRDFFLKCPNYTIEIEPHEYISSSIELKEDKWKNANYFWLVTLENVTGQSFLENEQEPIRYE